MNQHPILQALVHTVTLLNSNHLVTNGPAFTCEDGKPSLQTFDVLFLSFKSHIPTLYNNSPFLQDLDRLMQLPLNEPCFRALYVMKNNIYDILTESHLSPLYPYNPDKIQQITKDLCRKQGKLITITMTTCKRFDLFKRTINSMIECITDISQYVFDWIIVDDNSSQADREEIKKLYPFIRMIEKTPQEKGHPRSMNLFLKEMFTPYQLHVEDDWEFFIPLPYCKLLLDRIHLEKDIRQVLVNLNYTEDQQTASKIWGAKMIYKSIPNHPSGIRYFIHRYYEGAKLDEEHKRLGCPNSLYWPHFSFRVGLIDTSIYSVLGKFSETDNHFELEYAKRFAVNGFKTAFLDGIFCTHIGRRTYERTSDKLNAYDLNQEHQFGEPVKKTEQATTQHAVPSLASKLSIDASLILEANVINLQRRTDRLVSFFQKNQHVGIPISVFDAVDGKELQPTPEIQSLFSTGDFHYRRGIVGCALSHIQLWKRFASDPRLNYMLVLEDDVVLCKHFSQKLLHILYQHSKQPNAFDLLFLHYNPYPAYRYSHLFFQYTPVTVEQWPLQKSITENMGSGAAYVLTKAGAKALLEHIDSKGVYNAIDWVMFKANLKTAYTSPMLAFAECVQSGAPDSDIQNVYDGVHFHDWTLHEINRWKDALVTDVNCIDKQKVAPFLQLDEKIINNSPLHKIVIQFHIDQDNLQNNDKILIVPKTLLPQIEHTKGPFVWYCTDRCVFIIPYLYTNEEFLKSVPLFSHKLLQ